MYSLWLVPSIFLLPTIILPAHCQNLVDEYKPCPLLGPRFPLPTSLSTSAIVQKALANLTAAFDATADSDSSNGFTAVTPNTTSYSIALFSSNAEATSPMFYQYHHNALDTNSSMGMGQVDANSIYNAARVTTVFTVYAFLTAVGDDHWHDPITDHVPNLRGLKNQSPDSPSWADIRLIDLASNLAGIAKDGNYPAHG